MKILSILVLFTGLATAIFLPKDDHPVLYLVGDSTMSKKEVSAYPETGWGMPFVHFFNSSLKIENHARNGRSTRTFIQEGRWETILEKLEPGDFVFIQFGHNDEVQTKPRSTKPEEFQMYLRQYVEDSRSAGATPVLLTPITRRKFDEEGNPQETHKEYSALMREVADSMDVALIDMDRKSQKLMGEVGAEASKLLFLQLKSGQHPNYPEGIIDNTHFSETGARMIAELVLEGMQELDLDLNRYIRKAE